MKDAAHDRDYCHSILTEYTKSDSLLKHAYAVESCVRAYAEKFNEDVEYWGNVALLHDFDYEMFPTEQEHPYKGSEILSEKGFDEEYGARPLRRFIQDEVESLIADYIIENNLTADKTTVIKLRKRRDEIEVVK